MSRAVASLYGTKLGVVGAAAAIGHTLPDDHTFELVAYRTKQYCGSPRRVDKGSVIIMQESMASEIFNSYDTENKRLLITPHGPDPVLVGIRGETAGAVLRAFRIIKINEPVERWIIFRTNHGTDAHFGKSDQIVRIHSPAIVRGTINRIPTRTRGGHVFVSMIDNMKELTCAAYEPTGNFRNVVAELLPGDEVTVFGGVHDNQHATPTLNLEKIFIHKLAKSLLVINPSCQRCSKRLKSAGRQKGFKCMRCGLKSRVAKKVVTMADRTIGTGLYLPSLKAHRHLTKPLSRYGREKTWDGLPPIGLWHMP